MQQTAHQKRDCEWTLTGYSISCIFVALGWSRFCFQNCLNSKLVQQVAGNIPYRVWSVLTWRHHMVAADLLAALPWCGCHSTTSQRCSTGLRSVWLTVSDWSPFEYSELTFMFMKPVWDALSFSTWCSFWRNLLLLKRCSSAYCGCNE